MAEDAHKIPQPVMRFNVFDLKSGLESMAQCH